MLLIMMTMGGVMQCQYGPQTTRPILCYSAEPLAAAVEVEVAAAVVVVVGMEEEVVIIIIEEDTAAGAITAIEEAIQIEVEEDTGEETHTTAEEIMTTEVGVVVDTKEEVVMKINDLKCVFDVDIYMC